MIRSLRTFSRQVARYRNLLVLGAVLAIAEVIVRLAEPWPLRVIVDHALVPGATPWLGI